MTKHGMKTHAKSDSAILSAFPYIISPVFALSILSISYFLNRKSLISPSLTSLGLMSPGLMSPGLMSPGLRFLV